ncbi:SDR family oxidoreductase [Rhizobium etli]|uniref:SDR family oxidoreductase n=1 Tax=Rhizobium etli TaxID=29449 RepID=UPI000418E7A8|nr:SDR family oxidoreductase [Rhizobium etli]
MAQSLLDGSSPVRKMYEDSIPLGRFAEPDEVALAICHLLSDEASYTNGSVYN